MAATLARAASAARLRASASLLRPPRPHLRPRPGTTAAASPTPSDGRSPAFSAAAAFGAPSRRFRRSHCAWRGAGADGGRRDWDGAGTPGGRFRDGPITASRACFSDGTKDPRPFPKSLPAGDSWPDLPPLTEEEYDPRKVRDDILRASQWNQGAVLENRKERKMTPKSMEMLRWDRPFVREAVDAYERHMRYVARRLEASRRGGAGAKEGDGDDDDDKGGNGEGRGGNDEGEGKGNSDKALDDASWSDDALLAAIHPDPSKRDATKALLVPSTLAMAVRALWRCQYDTPILSRRLQAMERLSGSIGDMPVTDGLTYRLLEANAKAGHVRRTLALLQLRRRRGYPPAETREHWELGAERRARQAGGATLGDDDVAVAPGEREFHHVVKSIRVAQDVPGLAKGRNVHLHESVVKKDHPLEDPTRYLDAILVEMRRRGVPLRPQIAAHMLNCYATGRTGKAIHYFYRVVRDPIEEDGTYIPGPHPGNLPKEEYEQWKAEKLRRGEWRSLASAALDRKDGASDDRTGDRDDEEGADYASLLVRGTPAHVSEAEHRRTKVRIVMQDPPPFYKVPSQVGELKFSFTEATRIATSATVRSRRRVRRSEDDDGGSDQLSVVEEEEARRRVEKTRLEWELETEWSSSLASAFAFADSLEHGAAGHDPIALDLICYTNLIKACTYRGALFRAMKLADETMPRRGIPPDAVVYTTVMDGLARVGDVVTIDKYLTRMTNEGVRFDRHVVRAVVDGRINAGDVAGASSAVQDIFNQHGVLPPYDVHLKIIEFALGTGLTYEAKRHVYFLQQLWKWTPSVHHDQSTRSTVEAAKVNPYLGKESLKRLFRYFHEELTDDDFF